MSAGMHAVVADYSNVAHRLWTNAESAYSVGTERLAYWAMVDLRRSASYREVAGSQYAYCRARTFFGLVREICSKYDGVQVFKELGDGMLLLSPGLRPMIELACILDGVRRAWPASDQRTNAADFDFSFACTHGECMAVNMGEGSDTDFLGSPLDRVARMSALKHPESPVVMILETSAASIFRNRLSREYDFLQIGNARLLPAQFQKPGEAPIHICEMLIDRSRFDDFRSMFGSIR